MQQSRTPVDWLIAIVNIAALLLGLAIGWLWIFDAAGHYMANDNDPNIRIGMCLGFAMAYLVWTSVVTTYLVLKRRGPAEAQLDDDAPKRVRVVRVRRRVTVPIEGANSSPPPVRGKPAETAPPEAVTEEAYKASPPPVRVKPPAAAPAAMPALEPVGDVVESKPDVPESVAPPTPPAAIPISDAVTANQAPGAANI
jgi:hypothetical protein